MKTVERGAALLDKRLPGWEERIDLGELDLSRCSRCVLGQLYRRHRDDAEAYLRGLRALGLDQTNAASLGFLTSGSGLYENLAEAWRLAIRKRLR